MNFTIIIPHKNVPVLLERLLKSIPMRDDLEIIIVDDNSDPSIVDFEHFPGKGREHLTLILNKESHGAGAARNRAMPMAKGKWILFADSDDFFNLEFNNFLSEYVDHEADVIYFNANSVDTDTYEPSNRADHLNDFINGYQKDKEQGEIVMRCMFTEPWCKMIKRKIIDDNSITFDDTSIHEDVKFACLVGYYAKTIKVDCRQLYCVTSRINSLSRTQTLQTNLDELKVFARWKKFLVDNHPSLELPKYDYRIYNFTRHLYKDNELFRKEYKILKEVGFGHIYIIGQILKNLCKSVGYKLKL